MRRANCFFLSVLILGPGSPQTDSVASCEYWLNVPARLKDFVTRRSTPSTVINYALSSDQFPCKLLRIFPDGEAHPLLLLKKNGTIEIEGHVGIGFAFVTEAAIWVSKKTGKKVMFLANGGIRVPVEPHDTLRTVSKKYNKLQNETTPGENPITAEKTDDGGAIQVLPFDWNFLGPVSHTVMEVELKNHLKAIDEIYRAKNHSPIRAVRTGDRMRILYIVPESEAEDFDILISSREDVINLWPGLDGKEAHLKMDREGYH